MATADCSEDHDGVPAALPDLGRGRARWRGARRRTAGFTTVLTGRG